MISGREENEKRHHVKLVHEGNYVAEVGIELIEKGEGRSPYLSIEDVRKLDDVKAALHRGDIESASRMAKVYRLTPVNWKHEITDCCCLCSIITIF